MTPASKGWDWWSEVKLQILAEYLHGFTTAVRGRSREALCLDLFAGTYDNRRRHSPGTFAGSARVALETEPPFTRLAMFELPDPAAKLEAPSRRHAPATSDGACSPETATSPCQTHSHGSHPFDGRRLSRSSTREGSRSRGQPWRGSRSGGTLRRPRSSSGSFFQSRRWPEYFGLRGVRGSRSAN